MIQLLHFATRAPRLLRQKALQLNVRRLRKRRFPVIRARLAPEGLPASVRTVLRWWDVSGRHPGLPSGALPCSSRLRGPASLESTLRDAFHRHGFMVMATHALLPELAGLSAPVLLPVCRGNQIVLLVSYCIAREVVRVADPYEGLLRVSIQRLEQARMGDTAYLIAPHSLIIRPTL